MVTLEFLRETVSIDKFFRYSTWKKERLFKMSEALDILEDHITIKDELVYAERELDDRFVAIEVFSKTGDLFNLFYYVADKESCSLFYGDYKLPDGVVVKRILDGHEKPVRTIESRIEEPIV